MKVYEEEVISISAVRGIEGVNKYGVYACPLRKRYNYKPSLYLAFRGRGGNMYRLYKLRNRYELIPNYENIKYRSMDNADRKAILDFIKDLDSAVHQEENLTWQFYVLDTKHIIELPSGGAHSAGISPQCLAYYYLADMLDPAKCRCLRPCSQC